MAKKKGATKKSGSKPRKKPRTQAQKAATRAMLAANKAKRTGASKKPRKSGSPAKRRKAASRPKAARRSAAKKPRKGKKHSHWGKVRTHERRVNPTKKRKGSKKRKGGKRPRRRNPETSFAMTTVLFLGGLGTGIIIRRLGRGLLPAAMTPTTRGALETATGLGGGAAIYKLSKSPALGLGFAGGMAAPGIDTMIDAVLPGSAAPPPALPAGSGGTAPKQFTSSINVNSLVAKQAAVPSSAQLNGFDVDIEGSPIVDFARVR